MVLVLLFLLPRIFNLGNDISNSDAFRWHLRSENFLSALKSGDFKTTYQRYHPGVTIMWIGAAASQFLNEYQQMSGTEVKTLKNADFYPQLHALSKLFVLALLTLCFAVQLSLVVSLTDAKTAVIYGVIVSLEPYLVGISRWFHLTSMEAFFAFTALLLALQYLKSRKLIYIVFAGIFSGLGILTKMTVLISAVFISGLLLHSIVKKKIKFLPVVVYAVSALFTIFLLFPALWTSTVFVGAKMYEALFNAVTADPRGDIFGIFHKAFFYPITLAFKMTPVTAAVGLYSFISAIRKKDKLSFSIILYFVLVMVLLTVSDQKIDRYSVALFLPIAFLISRTLSQFRRNQLLFTFGLYIIFFFHAVFVYHPVYSAYVSPLFPYKFVLNAGFYENSGEYFADAARYINSKGRDTTVFVPNNIDAFSPYYKGKFSIDIIGADYLVGSLDFDRPRFPDLPGCSVDKTFGNRQYQPVAVYKCEVKKLPEINFNDFIVY